MTHFRSMVGVLVMAGGLAAAAQMPAQQINPNRHRPRPLPHGDSLLPDTYPDPPAVPQNTQVAAPQPPVQPSSVAPQASPAAQTPAATAPMPENLRPPTPPQVTYSNGLLTVQALNSTLGGLLQAIHNKTGIQFEGWEGGANERVVISMGPAPEGDVLAAILGGSKFDYVVLGRPDSPGTVQKVLLTPRGGGSTTAGAQPPRPGNVQGEGDDEDAPEETASGEPEPQDTPVRPPLTQIQPQTQPQNQIAPKTPEQLLEQLKQMQQQQQQQQQQQASPQNPAPTKPPVVPPL